MRGEAEVETEGAAVVVGAEVDVEAEALGAATTRGQYGQGLR